MCEIYLKAALLAVLVIATMPQVNASTSFSYFLQTNKQFYTSGETVELSIFCFDYHYKPTSPQFSTVNVYNPIFTKLKTFENVVFVRGKAKISFELPKRASEGDWTVVCSVGSQYGEQAFAVREPTPFSVKLEAPKSIFFYAEESFQLKLTTTYLFGEFVPGDAVFTFLKLDGKFNEVLRVYENFQVELLVKNVTVDSPVTAINVNFRKDLNVSRPEYITVQVRFTDKLTEKVVFVEKLIEFSSQRYKMSLKALDYYFKDQPIYFNVSLRGVISGDPAPPGLEVKNYIIEQSKTEVVSRDLTAFTDSSGQAIIRDVPVGLDLVFAYLSCDNVHIPKDVFLFSFVPLQAKILTKSPRVGSPVEIVISTVYSSIKNLSFYMASNNVLVSQGQTTFVNREAIIKFTPSLKFYPRTEILLSASYENTDLSVIIHLELHETLPNFVDLELSKDVTKPGQNVLLKVSSKQYSTVAVFCTDSAKTNDKNANLEADVLSEIYLLDPSIFGSKRIITYQPEIESETSGDTDMQIKAEENLSETWKNRSISFVSPIIRKNFAENIKIVDVEVVKKKKVGNTSIDSNVAEATVIIPIPHSITTFECSAVAMSPIYGVGATNKPVSLKVIKNFFIHMMLPNFCWFNTVLNLELKLFSYLDANQTATISVRRNDSEFLVLDPSISGWKTASGRYWQTFNSVPKKPKNIQLKIKAIALGIAKIRVYADGALASDIIEKQIEVFDENQMPTSSEV